MDSENNNQKVISCDDDGEYRVHCDVCGMLCIEQFYKNHLKSSTPSTNIRKRQQLNNINVRFQ